MKASLVPLVKVRPSSLISKPTYFSLLLMPSKHLRASSISLVSEVSNLILGSASFFITFINSAF